MRVLFDLRPRRLARVQEMRADPLRVAALLLFGAFVIVSLFNIAYTALNLRQMRAQLEAVRGELAVLAGQKARAGTEIDTMRARREKVGAFVAFAKEEMPSVEFLGSLEGAVPAGVELTRLEMKPGSVVLRGVAASGQDIVDLGGKLGGLKDIVRRVGAPVTARTASGDEVLLEFTMSCAVKTISEMALSPVLEIHSADLARGGRAR